MKFNYPKKRDRDRKKCGGREGNDENKEKERGG